MYSSKSMAIVLLVYGIASGSAVAPSAIGGEVFRAGSEGYHTFRIPALVSTPKGALLAICEGRKTSRADHGDVDLVIKRSTDGGRTWSALKLLHEQGGKEKITIGNPCPVLDRQTGVIWLPFTRDNRDVLITSSADDGHSWTKPVVITSQVKRKDWTWYATGPGVGIQLRHGPHRGRLIIPCDHRVNSIADRRASTASHIIYSDDHGASWKIGGITDRRMNECAVAELDDGRLMLNMRSNRGKGRRAVTISDDGGASWSDCADDPTLIEPVCQASLVRYWPGHGVRLVFSNPADGAARRRMTIRVSSDGGKSWPVKHVLHDGSAAYSCLSVLPDGDLGVLYERDQYRQLFFERVGRQTLLKSD